MAVVQALVDAADQGQTELTQLKAVARRTLEFRAGTVLANVDGS